MADRNGNLKRYGLTLNQFNAMARLQDGKCAICFKRLLGGRKDGVDHCHATGKVRGILCANCNAGLGHFRDDPDVLAAAIRYLAYHSEA